MRILIIPSIIQNYHSRCGTPLPPPLVLHSSLALPLSIKNNKSDAIYVSALFTHITLGNTINFMQLYWKCCLNNLQFIVSILFFNLFNIYEAFGMRLITIMVTIFTLNFCQTLDFMWAHYWLYDKLLIIYAALESEQSNSICRHYLWNLSQLIYLFLN